MAICAGNRHTKRTNNQPPLTMINLWDRSHETPPPAALHNPNEGRQVFIITASPVLAGAVGDYFRDIDGEITTVWLTSVDRALSRLGLKQAVRVVLDDVGSSTESDLAALKAAAPDAAIMLLAGGRSNEESGGGAVADDEHSPAPLRLRQSAQDQALAGHL
jgi:hypothetical protein